MSVICQAISTFIASVMIGFAINWNLSLFTIAFVPLIVIGTTFSMKIESDQMSGESHVIENATKIAIEAIGDIRTVASLHQQNYFLTKFTKNLETNMRYKCG